MQETSVELIELLSSSLSLVQVDETNTSVKDDLLSIVEDYPYNDTKETIEEALLDSYVEESMETLFQVDSVDDNIIFSNINIWIDILNFSWPINEHIIALQIILYVTTISFVNRQKLALNDELKEELYNKIISNNDNSSLLSQQYNKLYAKILSVNCKPVDLMNIYDSIPRKSKHQLLKLLGNQISDPTLQNFLQFENSYKSINISNQEKKYMTVQLYLEFNNITSNRFITIGDNIFLEIKEGKFCISNDEYVMALWNDFEFEINKLYFVLIELNDSKVTLYIDGKYINNVSLFEGGLPSFRKLEVGSMISSFKLYKLQLWEIHFPFEVISMMHLLGPLYQNSVMTPYNYEGIFNNIDKSFFNEIYENMEVTSYSSYNEFLNKFICWNKKYLLLDFDIANEISISKQDEFMCAFDNNDTNDILAGKCYYYKNSNLTSIFHSINFLGFVFAAIEKSDNFSEVYNLTEELVIFLREPTLINWFQKGKGFEMLGHVLHKCVLKFKEGLPIQFMELFINNFCLNSDSLNDILMRNEIAYKELILKFDLWYFTSKIGTVSSTEIELLRFIFFHINILLNSSKYSNYNNQEIVQFDTISNILSFYDQNLNIDLSFLENDIQNTMKSLILTNISVDMVQKLLSSAFIDLKDKNIRSSILCLKTINLVFSTTLHNKDLESLQVLHQCIHPRTILLLMNQQVTNKVSPMETLDILLKLFKMNDIIFKNFLKGDGIFLLIHILRNSQPSYFEDIIFTLYQYSIGLENKPNVDNSNYEFKASKLETISSPELLIIALKLLDWTILQDIDTNLACNFNQFVFKFCIHIKIKNLLNVNSPLQNNTFDHQTKRLLNVLLELDITLQKSQNSDVYSESIDIIEDIISHSIFDTMANMNSFLFEQFFTGIIFPNFQLVNNEKGSKNNGYLDFAFFIHILPKLFQILLDNDPSIYRKSNISSNVAILFNIFLEYFISINVETSFILSGFSILISCIKATPKSSISYFKNKSHNEIRSIFTRFFLFIMYSQFRKRTRWDSISVETCFLNLTSNKEIFFSKGHGFFNHIITAAVIELLIFQLNENPSISSVVNSIREILQVRGNDLRRVAEALDHTHKKELMSSFSKFLTTDTDESLGILLSLEEYLLTDFQLNRFMDICRNEAGILSSGFQMDKIELLARIEKNKQIILDHRLYTEQSIHREFETRNKKVESNITNSGRRMLKNYISDVEETFNYYTDMYLRLKEIFDYIHNIQHNKETNAKWKLDAVENINRSKKRLVPTFDYPINDFFLPDRLDKLQNSEEPMSKQKTNSNILSYDLVVDSDSDEFAKFNRKNENGKILRLLKDDDCIENVWNSSIVVGLDLKEGILILGKKYLYFVSNYYFSDVEASVMNIHDIPESYRDINIGLITSDGAAQSYKIGPTEVESWDLKRLAYATKRPFLLRDVAIEILFEDNTSVFFSFKNRNIRGKVYRLLSKLCKPYLLDVLYSDVLEELNLRSNLIGTKNGISKASLKSKVVTILTPNMKNNNQFEVTELWQNGKISNFYYLMVLNTLAGRSFNDLTQYPVFPWVISDYTSETVDLDDPSTFRDLSKPMGAQSEKRKNTFVDRFNALKDFEDSDAPAFHYGTHYSSAMIVSSYLIRLKPFTESFLLLQDGHFGPPDRLFRSVERAWRSAAIENTTDVRELVPEFYFLPEFLENINKYSFGVDQNGKEVDDVKLPPWANGEPKIFIAKNREALESPYVSQHLHEWIDLIFGYKQRGKFAEANVNVFNKLSYPGAIDLEKIDDENERRALTGIIHNFGQTPLQIFQEPHPKRLAIPFLKLNFKIFEQFNMLPSIKQEIDIQEPISYISHNIHASAKGFPFMNGILNYENSEFKISRFERRSICINEIIFKNLHLSEISAFTPWKKNIFITGDINGLIKVWSIQCEQNNIKLLHKATLYGHLHEIKSIHCYFEYFTILTLDAGGTVFAWDMLSHQLIRCIHRNVKLVTISQLHGTILLLTNGDELIFYNCNTLKYITSKINNKKKKITTLNFLDFQSSDPYAGHMYLDKLEMYFVGYSDGTIEIYQLYISDKNEWGIILLNVLNNTVRDPITCLNAISSVDYTTIHDQTMVAELTHLVIAAGTATGKLLTWK